MSVSEPSSTRLVGTLAAAGLVAGVVLVGVYVGTLPAIKANRAAALERAVFHVLPGASEFSAMRETGGALSAVAGEATEVLPGEVLYDVRAEDGRLVGYAIPADGPGFMDSITLLYGYDPARRAIVGFEVLESRETPGLGDNIGFDPQFLANFQELEVTPTIEAVKRGEKSAKNQVDTITGATISSKAVISILNDSVEHWGSALGVSDAEGG